MSFVLRPVLNGVELGAYLDAKGYIHPSNSATDGIPRSPVQVEGWPHKGDSYLRITNTDWENKWKGCYLSAGGYGCMNVNIWSATTSWRLYGDYLYSTWHGGAIGRQGEEDNYYAETYALAGKLALVSFPRSLNPELHALLKSRPLADLPRPPPPKITSFTTAAELSSMLMQSGVEAGHDRHIDWVREMDRIQEMLGGL